MSQLSATFDWQRCPDASRVIWGRVQEIAMELPFAKELAEQMQQRTGTRLADWVDHLTLSQDDSLVTQLSAIGYGQTDETSAGQIWRHEGALLPSVRVGETLISGVFLRVESVIDFATTHRLSAGIQGDVGSPFRRMIAAQAARVCLGVVERHGATGFSPIAVSAQKTVQALHHAEAFLRRPRQFENDESGFEKARELVRAATDDIGVDWTCDLFFDAERRYWESRNHAARVQKQRQDQLGLGWANHDHHTYRSSRECFARLVEFLELLGFQCRERFYGGAEAGWGAQVLEQRQAGIVIFADVDLSVSEVTGDFAHEGLEARADLGTVGLWCKLHGEAFLQAGMHHLECQFDFDAARQQLAAAGVETMKPFTDFDFLKQAFTVGERWPIDPRKVESALRMSLITGAQAERFLSDGAIGSHLEILQRDDGYKGFNQTGISEIIRATDPRATDPRGMAD
ncbi:MAG: hypothetical protein ACR2NZ_13635 [Rubripirellula sp.]